MAEHLESKAPEKPDQPRRLQWYRDPILIMAIPAVLILDQFTKLVVTSSLRLGESWPAGGFVRLTYAQNTGSAFGLFPNQTFALIVASLLAIGFLFYFYRTQALPSPILRLAIGMQLGGAVGNLLDRVRIGAVTDFIDVGPWPIFNLADSSIVVGMALLIGVLLLGGKPQTDAEEDNSGDQ